MAGAALGLLMAQRGAVLSAEPGVFVGVLVGLFVGVFVGVCGCFCG
jgi:hypothetical protein